MQQIRHLDDKLKAISLKYPEEFQAYISNNHNRFIYQVSVVLKSIRGEDLKVIDIGAGFSPCAILLSMSNVDVTVIDDFGDPMTNNSSAGNIIDLFSEYGVTILSGDIFTFDLPFRDKSLDAVISFDSMEHWHQSPKQLFHHLYNLMKDNGLFFIGVPNCVNLRKRLTVPFGYGKWSTMEDWYESPTFRGHVREPDISDLRYIANDIGFKETEIIGKNWIGYRSRNRLIRAITPLMDNLLQLNPALCSDLYLRCFK